MSNGHRHWAVQLSSFSHHRDLKPLRIQQGVPILTYESDGYAVSPSRFCARILYHRKAINPKAVDGIMHSTGSRQRRSYSFMVRAENWPWHGSIGELAI